MTHDAAIQGAALRGAREAANRFAIREASALETLLGILGAGAGGSMARGALGAVSPKVLPALENLGAAPINAVRRAFAPPTPANLLAKQLNTVSLPPLKGPAIR